MSATKGLQPGHLLDGRYRIESVLGSGRSATVYKARDEKVDTWVSLKVLDPFLVQDPVKVERFRREAEILRSLDHPNVIKIFSFFKDEQHHGIVMEYFDGVNLRARLDERGPLPVADFLAMAKIMCAVIRSCHGALVLHRDLKPQNVLVDARNHLKLVDFGISKVNTMSDLTKTGTVIGTPEYMAPELFVSNQADTRCDVYGLGAVFYEMLTGMPPYPAGSIQRIVTKQLTEEIDPISAVRADVPAWLELVVRKCLRIDPRRRYQSCAEISRDLEQGEQAACVREAAREAVACLGCHTELIPALPFCYHCGRLGADDYARGDYALAVYRTDDPDGLRKHLERVFSRALYPGWQKKLSRVPTVLLAGISRDTALALYNDLANQPCELQVCRRMPAEFRLPVRFAVLTAALCLPLLPRAGNSLVVTAVWLTLPGVASWIVLGGYFTFALGTVLALYSTITRPVLRLSRLQDVADPALREQVIAMAKRLKEVESPKLRFLLGRIAAVYFTVKDRGPLDAIWPRVWEATRQLSRWEIYLSGHSAAQLQDRKRMLELRIRQGAEPSAIDGWIREKADVEREYRSYCEIQELHSRTWLALLSFQGLLHELAADSQSDPAKLRDALALLPGEAATEEICLAA